METDSETIINEILAKKGSFKSLNTEEERLCRRARAFFVGLLGLSMSAIALNSTAAGEEAALEIENQMNIIGAARRVTKPLIRLALGSNKLSALVTAISSVLLLFAVMSKAWWRRGARWLAVPALLVASLELCADAADAALSAALMLNTEPWMAVLQTMAAAVLLIAEVFIWHCIARFFEQDALAFGEECPESMAIAEPQTIFEEF